VHTDNIDLLEENIDSTKKKSADAILDASKTVYVDVNTEKPKYLLMSPD
jgi:hypothetical protein